jgi:(S)-ureidoglycine aminohydrolase
MSNTTSNHVSHMLFDLGHTRSATRRDHLLQTPDTFVRAPLPGMRNGVAIVHISPAGGAKFVQYTAELAAGGSFGPADDQRFLYVLDGQVQVERDLLNPGDFAYLPAQARANVHSSAPSRIAVIEKPYQTLPGHDAPGTLIGREDTASMTHLNGDEWLEVRSLVPDHPAFDFRVNTMTYQPGASLPMVEMHVMEHGLLMLEGAGIYRLGDCWYPVAAGDFIWMAPYCPQWFGAIGKTAAKYLIYKDWDRHPRSQD